jgi:predicted DNA-binding protein
MSSEKAKKIAVRVTHEAHQALKDYCDQTGKTQIDVLRELVLKVIKPQLPPA